MTAMPGSQMLIGKYPRVPRSLARARANRDLSNSANDSLEPVSVNRLFEKGTYGPLPGTFAIRVRAFSAVSLGVRKGELQATFPLASRIVRSVPPLSN